MGTHGLVPGVRGLTGEEVKWKGVRGSAEMSRYKGRQKDGLEVERTTILVYLATFLLFLTSS